MHACLAVFACHMCDATLVCLTDPCLYAEFDVKENSKQNDFIELLYHMEFLHF